MMEKMSEKDIILLRLKCLEPYILSGSKHNIEKEDILRFAENAWEYAIKGIEQKQSETTGNQP